MGLISDLYRFALEDHVCRSCFGRVISCAGERESLREYLCTNCGLKSSGRAVSSLCCCGFKLKTGADAWVRCERNATVTPEFPSEIVAVQRAPVASVVTFAAGTTPSSKKPRRLKKDDVESGDLFEFED